MEYYSTNHKVQPVNLREAVMRGIAPDMGLYMPRNIPQMPRAFFNNMSDLSLPDIGYVVANMLFGQDVKSDTLHSIIADTLNFDIPLKKIDDNIYSLELFHGPTLAFKDVGARFMARLVIQVGRPGRTVNVLVATSGDSGGAVASGFYNLPGVNVIVLYPVNKMSPFQEAQFMSLGKNVFPVGVHGDFDDCQELVKSVFADEELTKRCTLISANSMNVARLLPQTFYYFYAYSRLPEDVRRSDKVVMAVPSGNLGNLTAGLIAKRMGLPVQRFVASNNKNDVFMRYLTTGTFAPRETVETFASAMDVGSPSNFERILDLYGGSYERISRDISGRAYSDEEIAETMRETLAEKDYLLDPHGATAYRALRESLKPGETGIFLETAHPAKFRETVEAVTGREVDLPVELIKFSGTRRRGQRIAPNADALKKFLSEFSNRQK